MKAIGQTELGGPEVLHFITVPMPVLGPSDLLVRVRAFAVNPADAKRRRGGSATVASPQILGFDGAGIVERVGSKATLFHVGDEVYFAGDATRAGCYAEFVAIDERIVGHKPRSLTFAEAAAVPLTALTAWESFFECMHVDPEVTASSGSLLIVGGAGGVGSVAIQIAKRVARLYVVATAGRSASADFCRQMGADAVINHSEEFVSQLRALGLEGADYILNCAELDNFRQLVLALNPLGIICSILGGEAAASLDVTALFHKRGTLAFEWMFTRPKHKIDMDQQGKILNRVADLLDQKILISTITQRLGWDQIQQAHRAIDSSHTLGKIVLEVTG